MNCGYCRNQKDNGNNPYAANIEWMAMDNPNFRTAIWTGEHLQMTLMCIPPYEDIGLEIHEDTDQFIRIEQGKALVSMGKCKNDPDFRQYLCKGDGVFIPAGTWHNVTNTGKMPLKVSSIYAPPKHKKGTIHRTKEDAEREEY